MMKVCARVAITETHGEVCLVELSTRSHAHARFDRPLLSWGWLAEGVKRSLALLIAGMEGLACCTDDLEMQVSASRRFRCPVGVGGKETACSIDVNWADLCARCATVQADAAAAICQPRCDDATVMLDLGCVAGERGVTARCGGLATQRELYVEKGGPDALVPGILRIGVQPTVAAMVHALMDVGALPLRHTAAIELARGPDVETARRAIARRDHVQVFLRARKDVAVRYMHELMRKRPLIELEIVKGLGLYD